MTDTTRGILLLGGVGVGLLAMFGFAALTTEERKTCRRLRSEYAKADRYQIRGLKEAILHDARREGCPWAPPEGK